MDNTIRSAATAFLLGCLLVCCTGLGQASPPYRSLADYRSHPQFCRDALSGRQLYVGEVFTRRGQCVRVQCLGTLQLWEDSCKVPGSLKGTCNVLPPTEANLNYPQCCPLYECKTDQSTGEGALEQTNTYDHAGNLRKSHVNELIIINKDPRPGAPEISLVPARRYQV